MLVERALEGLGPWYAIASSCQYVSYVQAKYSLGASSVSFPLPKYYFPVWFSAQRDEELMGLLRRESAAEELLSIGHVLAELVGFAWEDSLPRFEVGSLVNCDLSPLSLFTYC